jgi:hypothetical protein
VDAAELELLSESTDPIAAESEAINAQLSRRDGILLPGASTSDEVSLSNTDDFLCIYSPLRSIVDYNTSSPPRKRKANDLKVEVPLTPSNPVSSSPVKKIKRVTFPEMLHEYVPDKAMIFETCQPARDSDTSLDAFFNKVIEPIALEATQAMEQEQLQEADSLLRVQVPVMNFTHPTAPWKMYGRKANGKDIAGMTELDLQRRLLRDIKLKDLKQFPSWTGISKIERQLPWSPFPPELGKVAFDESIDDARYLQVIMEFMSLEDVVVSDSLTWKPDGLRILDGADESDDELEEFEIEESGTEGMDGLLGKRKRELEEEEFTEKQRPVPKPFEVQVRSREGPIQRPAGTTARPVERLSKSTHNTTMQAKLAGTELFGTTFSAATALSAFMQNMGHVSKRLKDSTEDGSQPHAKAPGTMLAATPETVRPRPFSPPPAPLPSPMISANPPSAFFILSSSLLQSQRTLVRSIGRLYSSANCVERDFSSLSIAEEADILLSPATGLILTTLQKIKQRALPGQERRMSEVFERLANLSKRYERVIVLVGEGAALTSDGLAAVRILDERDCDAIIDLNGFVSGLEADVQIMFVPGGEEDLVKWVVGCMMQYGIQTVKGEEVQLLQDETLVSLLLLFLE